MSILRKPGYGIIAGALGLLIAGCATTTSDCDPAQGGYLRGIGCSVSGGYNQRQEDRQETLREERLQQAQLRGEYEDTLAEQRTVRSKRRATEQQYSAVRRDLNQMQARLASSKTRGSNLQGEIAGMQSEVSMLEQDTFTPEAEKAERLERLMEEKAALEREIDMALER